LLDALIRTAGLLYQPGILEDSLSVGDISAVRISLCITMIFFSGDKIWEIKIVLMKKRAPFL